MSALPATGRLNKFRKDLVAIGPMAPVRVVYEVAKRSGAHGAMLRGFVGRAKSRDLVRLERFGPQVEVPDAARERTLADARLIVTEGHRAFGHRFPVNQAQDWNQLPLTELSWPDAAYWWDIDIRTDARIGDVKWTWELGRHRDLVVLARAATLEPEGQWLEALEQRLAGWFTASPSEVGIHWYSNLEIALRVIAWIQIYALLHERLSNDLTTEMMRQVNQAERHLLFDFPYTASSMRNNHLLGDALGLIAIDRFTGGDGSRRPAKLAEGFFASQLERHMHADGSMIEDSVSYHRFVMEMLVVKTLLGDESEATKTALAGSALHLVKLGVLEGEIPQWGDWDEGRVLASSGSALDLAGSTALALSISGEATENGWPKAFDEVAWHAQALPDLSSVRVPNRLLPAGGHSFIKRGPWAVWLKSSLQHSHQHADLTHVSVRYEDEWVVVDPGTGTYNGLLSIRNAFRTSEAHNGLRVGGNATLTPHRAFRWLGDPTGAASPTLEVEGATFALATHDAYVAGQGCRVARVVVVTDGGVACFDWLEVAAQGDMTLALAPEIAVDGAVLALSSGRRLRLVGFEDSISVRGVEEPFEGWHSRTYGQWEPSTWLKKQRPSTVVDWWAIGDLSFAVDGTEGEIAVDGWNLEVSFLDGQVTLQVAGETGEHLLRVGSESR